MLRWPHNHLEEEHLDYWITSAVQDDDFFKQTIELIDEWSSHLISEEEARDLKLLAQRGEFDLIYRYLDLQFSYRHAKDKEVLHDSLDLETQLQHYVNQPQTNHLLLEIGTRCIQHTLYSWFESLNLEYPPEFKNFKEADLNKKIQRILETIFKEQGFLLPLKEKLFMEDFLNALQKEDQALDYLNRFCSHLEQLMLWEETLQDILKQLEDGTQWDHQKEDTASLNIRLDFFEEELVRFHQHLGKFLSTQLLDVFSETQKAIAIGKFRKLFEAINNAYGRIKSKLLQEPVDLHLCCMCHFTQQAEAAWGINHRVIQILDEEVQFSSILNPAPSQSKNSLLIFTCGGGKGHLSTTKAMGQYALGKYHILVASTLEETLAPTDVLKRMLFDFSQEKLYNHLLKNEEFEWLKLLTSIGPFFIMMQQENIEKQIRLEVLKQNPDMIISCFPIMNPMFLNVAKEFNIPLLIVTTDLDTGLFVKGMTPSHCDLDYSHYKITLAYEDPLMRSIIEKMIPRSKIHISGFPVRPSFNHLSTKEELVHIRTQLQLNLEDQVILVMMGGNAGLATEKYAQIFAQCDEEDLLLINEGKQDLQIICLCGDQQIPENQAMLERINHLAPKTSRIKILGIAHTEAIADLMSIAEVLITKPGGCTTNEALAKKLPMIFHAPFALMDWEVFNMEFCIKVNMGSRFKLAQHNSLFQDALAKNKQRLLPLLAQAFVRRKNLRKATHLFESKDFKQEFLNLTEQLLATAQVQDSVV